MSIRGFLNSFINHDIISNDWIGLFFSKIALYSYDSFWKNSK